MGWDTREGRQNKRTGGFRATTERRSAGHACERAGFAGQPSGPGDVPESHGGFETTLQRRAVHVDAHGASHALGSAIPWRAAAAALALARRVRRSATASGCRALAAYSSGGTPARRSWLGLGWGFGADGGGRPWA